MAIFVLWPIDFHKVSCHMAIFQLTYTNLEFREWPQVFGDEKMTAALVDRLTHRAHILDMNGESYRFRESLRRFEAERGG